MTPPHGGRKKRWLEKAQSGGQKKQKAKWVKKMCVSQLTNKHVWEQMVIKFSVIRPVALMHTHTRTHARWRTQTHTCSAWLCGILGIWVIKTLSLLSWHGREQQQSSTKAGHSQSSLLLCSLYLLCPSVSVCFAPSPPLFPPILASLPTSLFCPSTTSLFFFIFSISLLYFAFYLFSLLIPLLL